MAARTAATPAATARIVTPMGRWFMIGLLSIFVGKGTSIFPTNERNTSFTKPLHTKALYLPEHTSTRWHLVATEAASGAAGVQAWNHLQSLILLSNLQFAKRYLSRHGRKK